MAINATVNDTTGYAPFMLAHGTELQLPLDLAYGRPPTSYDSRDEYVSVLCDRMETAFSWARTHGGGNLQRAKRRYDTREKSANLHVGDEVYLLKHAHHSHEHPKLYPAYDGPYRVVGELGDVNVRIQLLSDPDVNGNVHVDRLVRRALPDTRKLDDRDNVVA
jgi:hypothetical protein